MRHGSFLIQVSANTLIKVKVSFEEEDFANQLLNFSSEQSDVRKEPKIVEYFSGEGTSVEGGGVKFT